MFKFIFMLIIAACTISNNSYTKTSQVEYVHQGENMELIDIINDTKIVNIYINGEKQSLEDNFLKYTDALKNILKNAREMPSLGVSLHKETLNALQEGCWIEYEYETTKTHNEMPFDTLLIKLENNSYGLSIIRKFNGFYDGRCFYFDLDTPINISDLL